MSTKGNILIASSDHSKEEYVPVAQQLSSAGYNPVIYKVDKVLDSDESFTLNITNNGELSIFYEGVDISPKNILASWYRKVSDFNIRDKASDKAALLLLQDEVDSLHQSIWPLYDESIWLNAPENIYKAARKLGQLLVAKKAGFNIPETIVTSDWGAIKTRFFEDLSYKNIIVKMMRGVIVKDNTEMALPTTILDSNKVNLISERAVSFPGLYQEYINKYREWRVTVVGEEVFPVSIYTDKDAKDDWRKHQMTSSVTFKSERIDCDISEKCIKFLDDINLKFGAFDFVEKTSGEFVFLECNANGQYYALEERFNLPISSAITSELIKIAKA
ncbi:hypothetical protein EB118_00780 [bacterium]|nr:hypothetical protein [bacterium]NBX98407.1 hypothetical protein [bacterium]NDC93689.1 hypothetical protein [bacterium]NDD84651.1 hypothetical protein [bacterium]NDG28625.1 hypothetical protein [bacterium]